MADKRKTEPCEPCCSKKLKPDSDDLKYLSKFLKDENNKEILETLRRNLCELGEGFSNLTASFLHFDKANATTSASFSSATCDVRRIQNEQTGLPKVISIGVLFLNGYVLLKLFLDEENPKIIEDETERRALRDLLQFISSDHTILTENRGKKEMEWMVALRFAQHLMMPLVPSKTFCIDSYPCMQLPKCLTTGDSKFKVGDTSFGCAEGWHGKADIIIESDVPFSVLKASDEQDVISECSDTSVEVKRGENFSSSALKQMMAQTIVFSFLQVHKHENALKHSLIPGIGIWEEKLVIHLYDCDEDVLIATNPIDLYIQGKKLNTRMIIILWLALNYRLFSTGLTDDIKKYKSDFHQRLGPDYLEMYRRENERPLDVSSANREEYQTSCDLVLPDLPFKYYPLPKINAGDPLDV